MLTHDYSIARAYRALYGEEHPNGEPHFIKPISIGDNVFLGARSVILPGTTIGNNCIVGAGAVIKGNFPENSIIVGNPAKIIGNSLEFAKKHMDLQDFII